MNVNSIKTINDLKRDVLEEFIKTLPKEEKNNLKKFIEEHPQTNASGVFTAVRAYIFNTYFRTTPIKERKMLTFADTLELLLNSNEEEKEEL